MGRIIVGKRQVGRLGGNEGREEKKGEEENAQPAVATQVTGMTKDKRITRSVEWVVFHPH